MRTFLFVSFQFLVESRFIFSTVVVLFLVRSIFISTVKFYYNRWINILTWAEVYKIIFSFALCALRLSSAVIFVVIFGFFHLISLCFFFFFLSLFPFCLWPGEFESAICVHNTLSLSLSLSWSGKLIKNKIGSVQSMKTNGKHLNSNVMNSSGRKQKHDIQTE